MAPGKEKHNTRAKHASFWEGYRVCAFWPVSQSECQRWKTARRLRLGNSFMRVVNLGPSYAPQIPARGKQVQGGLPFGDALSGHLRGSAAGAAGLRNPPTPKGPARGAPEGEFGVLGEGF